MADKNTDVKTYDFCNVIAALKVVDIQDITVGDVSCSQLEYENGKRHSGSEEISAAVVTQQDYTNRAHPVITVVLYDTI